ncbi:9186_t:CDS:2, partial [Entrophospora sp. SA101]
MPYSLFSLFFTVDILDIIVYNTNIYADEKGAGAGRRWDALELKVQEVLQEAIQEVLQEAIQEVLQEVFQEVFQEAIQEVIQE